MRSVWDSCDGGLSRPKVRAGCTGLLRRRPSVDKDLGAGLSCSGHAAVLGSVQGQLEDAWPSPRAGRRVDSPTAQAVSR